MSILKTHSKSIINRYIGVFVPSQDNNYLILYALAKGLTKSEVIRQLIEEGITKKKECGLSVEVITNEIISQIQLQWKTDKALDPKKNFDEFKEDVLRELINKGIPMEIIEQILTEIE